MSLRVLHILSGDLWAGAEVATFHLLGALARRSDVSPRALVLNPGVLADRLEKVGIPVRVEPEAKRSVAALAWKVRRHAADVDLVHAHRYKENLLAALSGKPWVTTRHGRPEPFAGAAARRAARRERFDAWLVRRSARRAIAVSKELEQWLIEAIGADRVARAWNGIADPLATRPPRPWASRPRRVGAMGRLQPVKALDVCIEAVARIPDLELEIVGDGPERASLEARVAALGIASRVRFAGFDPHPHDRLESWRMLLLPSLHEGNPIAVLEALALGTPVMAGPLPGVAEILDGQGGWVLPSRDPEAWSELLSRRLADPAGGAQTSHAGRQRYLNAFTAERCAAQTARIYEAALSDS
jgi:glycosyltransferase involved in cell wall biosynthesis